MKSTSIDHSRCTAVLLIVCQLSLTLPALGEDCYTFVTRLGAIGPKPLVQPIDVAVDSEGYAYITEGPAGEGKIKKFKADGSEFCWCSDMERIPMGYPQGVAVDAFGYVYVTDFTHQRLCVFRQDNGSPVGWFGGCDDASHAGYGHWHDPSSDHTPQLGHGPGQFWINLTDVDVDSQGHVYAAENGSHRVQVLRLHTDNSGSMSLEFVGWFGGCDHKEEHVGNDRMHTISSTHQPQAGDGSGFLEGPLQIAAAYDGFVYVSDSGSRNLQLFTAEGLFVQDWQITFVDEIWGMHSDAEGNVFVSNTTEYWVGKCLPDMTLACSWGSFGTGDGQFLWPGCMDIDCAGRVYIADSRRGSVHVFAPTSLAVKIDIKPGSCPNPLNVKNVGVLLVAVLGTADFDVTTIDAASLRLEGVAPIRSALEDVATPVPAGSPECACTSAGPDGCPDLTLRFDVQAVVAALGEVQDGDVVPLMLTGTLREECGGWPIEGKDCVVILSKGGNR